MIRFLTRRCVLGVMVCAAWTSSASAQLALRPELPSPSQPSIATTQGELHGIVRDEQGRPISGAVVSALGSVSLFAVSDADGRFTFRTLPAGPYLVRAHLQGYLPERGRVIQVSAGAHAAWTLALTRLGSERAEPAVLAAGVGATEPASTAPADSGDDHSEVAWRMRHAPRSVLKDAETALAVIGDEPSAIAESLAGIGRAVGAPARVASAIFADVPLNGQIHFLTASSFDRPQDLFSANAATPRIAYVTLAAPVANGEWNIKGAVTEGDVASWIVAGSYKRTLTARHQYEAGLSYSVQRYLGANPEALAAMRDGSRSVGAIDAYDTWVLNPRLSVGYGGKYASYDYLADRGLLSPRGSVTVEPFDGDPLKLRALVSHRETAPGAEEFLPPALGVWLPPERTFSSLSRDGFTPERLDHVEVAAEREVGAHVIVGMRTFRQRIDDQTVTLFGMMTGDSPQANGHYHVASAGNVEAHGWGVSVSRQVADGVRASVDYTQIAADWRGRSGDEAALARIAPAVLRTAERINDLTASVETTVAPTATRVFVVYKVSDSFAGADSAAIGSRFDLQVNQALPFLNFSSARWEMLVAVRTLFHDDPLDGSVYDELLVVRAPKRVVGGVTVHF